MQCLCKVHQCAISPCLNHQWKPLSTSCSLAKEVLKSLKGRKPSSQEWLRRQLVDPYVEKSKRENYRCRSAFKLIEIDDKQRILRPGQVVLDCGAAPGSWTQVALSRVTKNVPGNSQEGVVIGIDLKPMHPIEGAVLLGGNDFTKEESKKKILGILNQRAIDVVLSDMAPNSTGVKTLDQELIIQLAQSVIRFALEMSALEASLLIKVWDGRGVSELEKTISRFYASTKRIKPPSSRGDSAELFILSKGFKGIKR